MGRVHPMKKAAWFQMWDVIPKKKTVINPMFKQMCYASKCFRLTVPLICLRGEKIKNGFSFPLKGSFSFHCRLMLAQYEGLL
uniref:Uncharacterized protein n=1 Tax=Fundulus heteroclitus TaxID=8078 RepID=A0A3Q2Q6A0_FUNHE